MRVPTVLLTLALIAGSAAAKLPALSDEAKAKAAEAAARTAWSDKVAAYQLCQAMDRVAAAYLERARTAGKAAEAVATPPCADPGTFAYTPPPDPKPIEAAGAHSPPQTAATPPSTTQPAASGTKP